MAGMPENHIPWLDIAMQRLLTLVQKHHNLDI